MTEISLHETILSRQLRMLAETGIDGAVITTGYLESILVDYCRSLEVPFPVTFVRNDEYEHTNYIYSIYCARKLLDDDILLFHGDMVFENSVLDDVMKAEHSCMTVSLNGRISQKDFKAVVQDGTIKLVSTDFFGGAVPAQPLYKIFKNDWNIWLSSIVDFCESGCRECYAEDALNEVSTQCCMYPMDIQKRLCNEIDDARDLAVISDKLHEIENRTVYMCFSTDILHGGHIGIIRKAQRLGKLIIGVMSDEAAASYKRCPLLPFEDRKTMMESIKGIYKVVEQKKLSYKENLERYKPTYLVHGDDWRNGFQKPVRQEAASVLASYGGQLVEYPYAQDQKYQELEDRTKAELSMPDIRRGRLKRVMELKGLVTAMEAHDGLTGLIVENTVVHQDTGSSRQFDAIWVSSLCDSTTKGKPDIELVDMTSRFRTIGDLMEVTTKPVIFDGDTGGRTEHFVYTVRSLERMGVSMVIIEDKTGLKKNSLFGTEVGQVQESIESFCEKISAGKKAQKTKDFMICARIESLVLDKGMKDALTRARAFVAAGADAIMIHSCKKEPDEIFEFISKFRIQNRHTPLVLVPTSYASVTEEEFKKRGANIVIYANQLMRAAVPAIQKAAEMILASHRSLECEDMLMPFSEIIRLIPEEA